MRQLKDIQRESAPAADIEHLLKTRYSQLIKWSVVLTRGDAVKAQDIVQDLCLYFTLAKPALSNVTNLDGYLYQSLRHIYLSSLARSAREAMYVTSVADFDSFDFAIEARQDDPLERQNDLRQICSYVVWRKEQSKTASYFILHFFHGYSRHEISELAVLPISAIYNKLKTARTEIKGHLANHAKVHIIGNGGPPVAPFSWTLLSPIELFKKLREMILSARLRDCLPEEELLSYYSDRQSRPVPCALLSHIVSCELCLDTIDRYFNRPTLAGREPLDSLGPSPEMTAAKQLENGIESRAFKLVRGRRSRIYEHRPNRLSIALNGRIIASHDVQSIHSTLSARIEAPEKDHFVEVFSDQDVRFALLSIHELPPQGPGILKQLVILSDSRWLELVITFDGLGLHSEVSYFDPALTPDPLHDELEDDAVPVDSTSSNMFDSTGKHQWGWVSTVVERWLRPLVPSPVVAWALVLAVLAGVGGYLKYRHSGMLMSPQQVLTESIRVEMADFKGQTEHQVLRVEEISADEKMIPTGTIDLWRDGDGARYVRRFYNPQHHLVAAKWKNRNGEHSSPPSDASRHPLHDHLVVDVWDQDLSATAFQKLGGTESMSTTTDGYELTVQGPLHGNPQLVSATLVLDKHFVPVAQTLTIRRRNAIRRVRLTETSLERKSSSAVPDSFFDPNYSDPGRARSSTAVPDQDGPLVSDGTNVQLAQLQIAVLYQLYSLKTDIGEPIEVVRTAESRIRVSGEIEDPALRQRIASRLANLDNHALLDLRLNFSRNVRASIPTAATPELYDAGAVKPLIDSTLREYFQSKGTSADLLNSAVAEYSQKVLRLSQRALQNAYAIDRLGNVFPAAELSSVRLTSQRQWTEMVYKHAEDLDLQLKSLHAQLAMLTSNNAELSSSVASIENAPRFADAASGILHQTQNVNSDVGMLFAADISAANENDVSSLLTAIMRDIPLKEAEELIRFATRLKKSEEATGVEPHRLDNRSGDHGPTQ